MMWTLLIWVVVGLVTIGFVWPAMVLMRAVRNGCNLVLYWDGIDEVLEEDAVKQKTKYNPIVRALLIAIHNFLWPYKLIWLTKDLVPRFDERYEDLMLEKLEKGEAY